MSRRNGMALGFVAAAWLGVAAGQAVAAAAEIKLDRDFLAGLLEKSPPCPFEKAGQYRGKVDSFRLIAIDPKARQVRVSCTVAGEFNEKAVVAGLKNPPKKAAPPATPAAGSRWQKFRFDVGIAVNIEPGPDGTPRFRFTVDYVTRRELDGMAGALARVMGKSFDLAVTRFAEAQTSRINDRLNAEVIRRVANLKDYGVLCGVDYSPGQIVVLFDQTRLRSEGVVGHVYLSARPGTVPLYRWVNPKRGDHYYTTSRTGPDPRTYKSEGVACHVFAEEEAGTMPLQRWAGKRECFYATSPDVGTLRKAGYRPEGVACFVLAVAKADAVPFYRFADPRTGLHFYTVDPHAEFAK